MPRFTVKLLVICFLSAFFIFFAVDMATKGTERINGPLTVEVKQTSDLPQEKIKQDTVSATSTVDAEPAVAATSAAAEESKSAAGLEPVIKDNNANHVPEKIGGLLQITADHSIKLVVSLFQSVFE